MMSMISDDGRDCDHDRYGRHQALHCPLHKASKPPPIHRHLHNQVLRLSLVPMLSYLIPSRLRKQERKSSLLSMHKKRSLKGRYGLASLALHLNYTKYYSAILFQLARARSGISSV